jgi:hypothetical protein
MEIKGDNCRVETEQFDGNSVTILEGEYANEPDMGAAGIYYPD